MLPTRGRPGATLVMTVERQLTAGDLLQSEVLPAQRVAAPTIQRLKAAHHAAARLLASGRSIAETAAMVGRTPQRISDLASNDESFQWLVSYYREQVDDAGIDEAREFQGRLKDVARSSLEEIQDRLDDDKQRREISVGELRQLAVMGLDRTIAPPKTAQPVTNPPTHITFKIGAKDIRPKERTIEHESNAIGPPAAEDSG